jgi:hypothetical protein
MIQQVKIEIIEEENRIQKQLEESLERDKLNSLSKIELLKQEI